MFFRNIKLLKKYTLSFVLLNKTEDSSVLRCRKILFKGQQSPYTQMSAYPIFDKFGKLSGEKKIWKFDKIWLLDPKHISLLHTQYLEDSTAPALS